MPITFTIHETPRGKKYIRTHSFGVVTGEDAESMMSQLRPGAPLEGAGVLSIADSGTDLRPEARRVFTENPDASSGKSPLRYPVGIVLNSAPLRVVMSFVIRVSGSSDFTKFFSNEAEATAWVVERLDSK